MDAEVPEDIKRTTFARLVHENIIEVEAACRIVPAAPPAADDLLKSDRVAAMLAISPRTLENWRRAGKGPKVKYVEEMVRYRYRDLLEWLDAQVDK